MDNLSVDSHYSTVRVVIGVTEQRSPLFLLERFETRIRGLLSGRGTIVNFYRSWNQFRRRYLFEKQLL